MSSPKRAAGTNAPPAAHRQRAPVAPAVVFTSGLAERWELVVRGDLPHSLVEASRRSSLLGGGLFLKGVLREGGLQGKSGPSIATEFGFLLPSINEDPANGP